MVKLGQGVGNHLLVPRRLAPSLGKDCRVSHSVPAISCKAPPLDEEQAEVIAKSIQLLKQGVDHVLEAPTGWGKTYAGSAVAAELSQTTLIVVTKTDLMGQWTDTLVRLIGVDPTEIGIAQAAKLVYKDKRFVLATVQSLIRPGKYDLNFFNYFGLVLFDETHRMAADCFSRACFLFPARHRLGLSATPKRSDGKMPVVEAHIGPVMSRGVVIPMSPKVVIKKTGWKVPDWAGTVDSKGHVQIDPGNLALVYKAMANIKVPGTNRRNEMIVRYLEAAYLRGRTVVVMSDHIANLHMVRNLAIHRKVIPVTDFGEYTGDTPKTLLKTEAHKRVVLATYGMCGEGTDYPHWDTMVQITPRANVEQSLGRILRKMNGKAEPIALDLVDDHPTLKGFHFARQNTYFKVKGRMVTV
jgi:superfamily II DNA or RNA helicase